MGSSFSNIPSERRERSTRFGSRRRRKGSRRRREGTWSFGSGGMEGRRWWRRRGGRREYEGDERSRGEREDESGSSSEVTRDDRVCISR